MSGRVHVSNQSGKTIGLKAINTNPLENGFCHKMSQLSSVVCSLCYSRKMLQSYRKSCVPAFSANNFYLSRAELTISEIPRIKTGSTVRFNAHGELLNLFHAINCIKIAFWNPDSIFALWTKRPALVQDALRLFQCSGSTGIDAVPNLTLVYSEPILNSADPAKLPKNFHHVFSVYTSKHADSHNIHINCEKKCIDCMKCYRKNTTVHINELVK